MEYTMYCYKIIEINLGRYSGSLPKPISVEPYSNFNVTTYQHKRFQNLWNLNCYVTVHTDPLAAESVLMQMSQAIDVLTSWMAANRLLLNPSKTQAIWLGGHRQLAKIDGQRLSFLFPHIAFSTCVRDLGAMLDSELTFR